MVLSSSEIKRVRALQQKKFRKESGLFVVEGVKTVGELVRSDFSIDAIYATEEFDFFNSVDPDLICFVKEKELERISGLRSPNKILALAKIPDSEPIQWNTEILLLLDGINDPGNIGTIIRTAKWFGVETILCSDDCADAFDRKVVQSTMGALFHVNMKYCELSMVMDECRKNGFTIVGAAMNGSSVYQYSNSPKTALVIGSESHGISKPVLEKCQQLITIPNNETSQKIESLNAGVATSIILSELTRPH